MPSRVLGMKTPYEMIFGENEFIVPPKVGKLDPRCCEVHLDWILIWIKGQQVLES
jgi:hypothetical protein